MTNPTTPFSWQMPQATDLVTDLPADFAVFGQAVATSMGDLLGGTTGQILSKATNTDMDFTWVTNDVGDITAVTAGTGISGGGTSGAVTITNDMATTITASGDIVIGTGSGTYDNLPIGTTGQILTADTTVSPYKVKWATASSGFNTGRNLVSGQESTTSTSYTDLATSQAVTVTTGTKALVAIVCQTNNGGYATVNCAMGFAISGATTVAASDNYAAVANGFTTAVTKIPMSATFLVTGLTAGSNTFTLKFKSPSADTSYFLTRTISVIDLGS